MKNLKLSGFQSIRFAFTMCSLTLLFLALNLQLMSNNRFSAPAAPAGSKADLEKAKKEGRLVFLVITDNTITKADKAKKIAKEASAKVEKSMVLMFNRDEPDNKSLVAEYSVATLELPFILIISPKGVAVGGYPENVATSDMLLKGIPSPKQDEVLVALDEKKPVFIVISKSGLTDKETITTNCKNTSAKMSPKATVVEIDFADQREAAFLKQLGITAINDKTITVVTNNTGIVTDTYIGNANESKLMSSAYKRAKSGGCCPGGSGSSGCGPKK